MGLHQNPGRVTFQSEEHASAGSREPGSDSHEAGEVHSTAGEPTILLMMATQEWADHARACAFGASVAPPALRPSSTRDDYI